jgi:hypothetical protein
MTDDLTRRLEAVERAVTDGHTDLTGVADATDVATRLDALERRLDEIETRLDETEAATQALRGYLGGVDGVSDAVERRADLALAKAEALEDAVFHGRDGLAVERLPDADMPEPGADTADDSVDTLGAIADGSVDATHTAGPTAIDDRVRDAGSDAMRSRPTVSTSAPPSPSASPSRSRSPSGDRGRSPTRPSADTTDREDRSFLTRLRDAL